MFDDLTIGWLTPLNIEIGTREEQPDDTNPLKSEKETFNEDTNKDADGYH